jgi:hypothetical protein
LLQVRTPIKAAAALALAVAAAVAVPASPAAAATPESLRVHETGPARIDEPAHLRARPGGTVATLHRPGTRGHLVAAGLLLRSAGRPGESRWDADLLAFETGVRTLAAWKLGSEAWLRINSR